MPKINKKNKTYKSFDFTLFITVILLLSLGVTMVLSASSPSSLATTGSSYTYVKKQAFCAVLGVALMLIISKIDYRKYQRFYKIAYVVSLFILLLVILITSSRLIFFIKHKLSHIKLIFLGSFLSFLIGSGVK